MTIRVVDHLTERNVRAKKSDQGSDGQKDHAVPCGARLHHRQQCSDALVLEECQSTHSHKLFVIERLPARSGFGIVLGNVHRAEYSNGDDHQIDNYDRVNIAVLEDLESPDPGDGGKYYERDGRVDPEADLDFCPARRLVCLRYNLLASASKEAEHCETIAEVEECHEDLENVLVGLAKRVLDQISVGINLSNPCGLDESHGRKGLDEAGEPEDDG